MSDYFDYRPPPPTVEPPRGSPLDRWLDGSGTGNPDLGKVDLLALTDLRDHVTAVRQELARCTRQRAAGQDPTVLDAALADVLTEREWRRQLVPHQHEFLFDAPRPAGLPPELPIYFGQYSEFRFPHQRRLWERVEGLLVLTDDNLTRTARCSCRWLGSDPHWVVRTACLAALDEVLFACPEMAVAVLRDHHHRPWSPREEPFRSWSGIVDIVRLAELRDFWLGLRRRGHPIFAPRVDGDLGYLRDMLRRVAADRHYLPRCEAHALAASLPGAPGWSWGGWTPDWEISLKPMRIPRPWVFWVGRPGDWADDKQNEGFRE